MLIINSHIVKEIIEPVRFCDYCNGLFKQLPSRAGVKKAIKKGELILNGLQVESGRWIKENDKIEYVDLENRMPKDYHLELEVVFEDDYFAVINKPAGIVVSGNQFKTIENCLHGNLKKSKQIDALKYPKPVHRLDAPTSGLLLIAKTKNAHINLGRQFENKTIQKKYAAIVQGVIKEEGVINKKINGQKAFTKFKKIKTISSLRNKYLSLVELSPETGRTHQLRIHLSELGHPIVGDVLYGKKGNTLLHKGLFLVAISLELKHPVLGNELEFKIDLPNKFDTYLERETLRWNKFKTKNNNS